MDFEDGTSTNVDTFAVADAEKDVAIIRVDTKGKTASLTLARDLPSEGDEVVAISHFARDKGKVTRILSTKATLIATTAKSDRGFSGGPLVNLEGEVLGMMSKGGPGSDHTIAVAATEIRKLLADSCHSHHALPVPGAQIRVGRILGSPGHGVCLPRDNWALVVVSKTSQIRDSGGHGVYLRGNHNAVNVLSGHVCTNGGHGIFISGDKNVINISGGETFWKYCG